MRPSGAAGTGASGSGDTSPLRPAGSATATTKRPVTVGAAAAAAARKPSRRARLTITRVDPWSMLKFSFVYSLAGLVVLLVAVVVLYGIIDAMGVIDAIRSFVNDIKSQSSDDILVWFSFSRVLLVTLLVGIVNVILFTAFATLTAFIYNVCTDIVGGVEVTMSERP
jgi:Transmembrane domain of unknown function (DUF3566)